MGVFRHPITVTYVCYSTEIIQLSFDILGEMQQWEVDWGKERLLMRGCQTYGLRGMSSQYVQHPPTLA
jgi:hypothetical protein